jgi:acyl-CoA-binding protein
MSDNNEEYPETGTGGGGTTLVTDPVTENAVEHDESTTPQMGYGDLQPFALFKQSVQGNTNQHMPGLVQIRAAYVHTYDLETVQTIIAKVENMEDTERLTMLWNMIHLNQMPPTGTNSTRRAQTTTASGECGGRRPATACVQRQRMDEKAALRERWPTAARTASAWPTAGAVLAGQLSGGIW